MTKLGQHFLKSKKIIDEIIKTAELNKSDTVLEAGPGKGTLTEALLQKANQVIAVEKDEGLFNFLSEKFKNKKNIELIYGDILKLGNSDLLKKLKIKNYKIVANIPYYITSHFLRQFLETKLQPDMMVLLLQKEVAERICTKNRKESILSISVKAYGVPKIIKKVPARYFSPKPKVDSAIIKISSISRHFFSVGYPISHRIKEGKFFELVKKGFSQKRKMLKNNLKISKEELKKCGLDEKVRAEKLNLENWKCLYFLRQRLS